MGKESRMLLQQNVHDRCTDQIYYRGLEDMPETSNMEHVKTEGVRQRRAMKCCRWRTTVLVEWDFVRLRSKVVQA